MAFFRIFKRWGPKTPVNKAPVRENMDILMNIMEYSDGISRGTGAGTLSGIGWSFGKKKPDYSAELPEGSITKKWLKWDPVEEVWYAVILKDEENEIIDGYVAKDEYIVRGIKDGTTGSVQLKVQKMPEILSTTDVTNLITNTVALPPGDEFNLVMKWDKTAEKWEVVKPVEAENEEGSTLGEGNSVVTDVLVGTTGLLQLKTAPLPKMDGIPAGYSERANSIIDIKWDSDYKKIQIKTGTVLVKDSTESEWLNKISFTAFND